jgi:hypothetical protein
MLSFLVYLLVMCLVFGVIYWAVSLVPLPPPLRNIVLGILALIFVLVLLGMLFGGIPLRRFDL